LEAADAGPVPIALVAVTVKVYAVPFVKPVTVIGLDAPVAVMLPGLEVTVYEIIALPPFEAGGVKLTVAWALPAVAVTPVGAPGTVGLGLGVTLFEAADAGPLPIALVAFTVKVYAVPFVSPVRIIGLDAPVAVMLPGLEVTVYEVIALPPFEAGGAKLTVACWLTAVAVTAVGAPGTVAGVTLLEAAEAGPVPITLVAFTVKV
jgi:hypothetical protein